MAQRVRIGIVAPASRVSPTLLENVVKLAEKLYPERVHVRIHPQCFRSSGHFAGSDEERAQAFLDYANDESLDAIWFARGGYGSGRIASLVLPGLNESARRKTYLGYSDAGALLGAMYANGFKNIFHGPMAADLGRENGEKAVLRALRFLVERDRASLEPSVSDGHATAAFNITILAHLAGTAFLPDLTGHILMLEEVSEAMYRVDRALWHLTNVPSIKRAQGIRLGRVSLVPDNEPQFGEDEVAIVTRWCQRSAIPYLGRADIGHDVENKVVPFGAL